MEEKLAREAALSHLRLNTAARIIRNMNMRLPLAIVLPVLLIAVISARPAAAQPIKLLPKGSSVAVWDLSKAAKETTATRERICINGLWQWQPAQVTADTVPAKNWGYFKVPGPWPGITDYMQKESQNIYSNDGHFDQTNLGEVKAAWYQREITIPKEWTGRRITLATEYLNSFAAVYVDGNKSGEIQFPAGEVDLSAACRPGQKYQLSLLVVALPLKGVMVAYTDSAAARQVKGSVARRGLCGDVWLTSTPAGPRLGECRVTTSVRKSQITFDASLDVLGGTEAYSLKAEVLQDGKHIREFASPAFSQKTGKFSFTADWKPADLWDLNTPANQYDVRVSLLDRDGKVVDTALPVRFGFRELWIDGKDYFLNGSRVFLCAVPVPNAEISAGLASYEGARASFLKLKAAGINFVYAQNYDCEPGSHLSFDEILRAADDVGMLVALTQPHFSGYDWSGNDADEKNGYARHAAFYAHVAGNHPSAVFYAMSHNATGYDEDMNPDLIDGIHDQRDQWSVNNVKLAMRAQAIVNRLDPSRIVYHHASGNLGSMHTINFYPNFAPAQELSDWFGHWAKEGTKPVFLCEYAAPFTWDWTMYRGWYKGQREFGSAEVPWEFCNAEWNAQFLGDRAYALGEPEKANLRWEAKEFRDGRKWHRWDYPSDVGSSRFDDRYEILAQYTVDNWRAFRTWGVSGISPWDFGHFWKSRDGVNKARKEIKTDWEHLQRPGYSPDFVNEVFDRMDVAYDRADWIDTAGAKALLQNNQPMLAYIGGGVAAGFTAKDHNYLPGEKIEKQLIVINNSRRSLKFTTEWKLNTPGAISGSKEFSLPTGEQMRVPLQFELPANVPAGSYKIEARIQTDDGQKIDDAFSVDVLPAPQKLAGGMKTALFDPKGETAALLDRLKIPFTRIEANGAAVDVELLIIGKGALTVGDAFPDMSRVGNGLKVIVFEQSSEALEKRLGFRTVEYGLRRVFARIPDHPALAGIGPDALHDWRGESTITPSRLTYERRPQHGPTVKWCDIPVSRVWRCGNRGNVASVLIEKPARGDFLPIIDGGFSLQYSPLMEYRKGKGMVLFCQLDVTGRNGSDPAADAIAQNLMRYASTWKPPVRREILFVGDPAARTHIESAGFKTAPFEADKLSHDALVVIATPGGEKISGQERITAWLKEGGHVLGIGLEQDKVNAFSPQQVRTANAEHIGNTFDAFGKDSPMAGISPADIHNRDPRKFYLVTGGLNLVGDGILARSSDDHLVICQLTPWTFTPTETPNVKRTFRRSSFLLTRLLSNMGASSTTQLVERFGKPAEQEKGEKRWAAGLYSDQPEEWDDPYRFFRW